MVLRLDSEELDLMRSALEQYERSVRAQLKTLPASDAAIEVCARRLRIEALLDDLDPARQHSPASSGNVIPMPSTTDNAVPPSARVA